ncbi:MAG: hypothetical protein GF349_05055 [Candidatus Magasanikbacteria bacterium]|nr:hypothetical protein [Candidatus Magasanikbacteria bacterium]
MSKNKKYLVGYEYRHFILLRAVSLLITVILILGFGVLVYFIQQRIFATIEQVQSIITYSSDLGLTTIDFDDYEKVESYWDDKYESSLKQFENDPFNLTEDTQTDNLSEESLDETDINSTTSTDTEIESTT